MSILTVLVHNYTAGLLGTVLFKSYALPLLVWYAVWNLHMISVHIDDPVPMLLEYWAYGHWLLFSARLSGFPSHTMQICHVS